MSILTSTFRVIRRDAPRALILLAIVIIATLLSAWQPLTSGHPELAPILTAIEILSILSIFSHVLRRTLFHKLDFQEIAIAATAHPIGAAIVFFSISIFLSVLIFSFSLLLH